MITKGTHIWEQPELGRWHGGHWMLEDLSQMRWALPYNQRREGSDEAKHRHYPEQTFGEKEGIKVKENMALNTGKHPPRQVPKVLMVPNDYPELCKSKPRSLPRARSSLCCRLSGSWFPSLAPFHLGVSVLCPNTEMASSPSLKQTELIWRRNTYGREMSVQNPHDLKTVTVKTWTSFPGAAPEITG